MRKVTCKIFIIISLSFLLTNMNAKKILVIIPTPFYSHQLIFRSLCSILNQRGHELTVVTSVSMKNPTFKNYTEIVVDLKNVERPFTNSLLELPMTEIFKGQCILSHEISQLVFNDSKFMELYKRDNNEKFDAVIIELIAYPSLSAMAYRFNASLIGFLPLDMHNFHRYIFGGAILPSHLPNNQLILEENPSIWERIWNFIDTWRLIYYWLDHLIVQHEFVKKYLGNDVPYILEIIKNTSVMLINENPVLIYPRAEPPNAIFFSDIHIQKLPPPLSEDLKLFLDDATEGFIYVSFGTIATCHILSNETLRNLTVLFSKLPYKIVWKFECNKSSEKFSNIFISKWFPQQSVLAHPNIKLFISHGGAHSIEEALYYAVPILGVPCVNEQENRIRRLVSLGVTICIKLKDVTIERLNNGINDILNNKSYKENMMYLSSLSKDQQRNNTEKIIWWIEFVMRHKRVNFRCSESDKSWYQRHDMDIIAFLSTILFIMNCIIALIIIKVIRFVLNNTIFFLRH